MGNSPIGCVVSIFNPSSGAVRSSSIKWDAIGGLNKGALTFGDVVSLAVHDLDNKEGVKAIVEFQGGEQTITPKGDGELGGAQETLLKKIVRSSYDEVVNAYDLAKAGKDEATIFKKLLNNGVFFACEITIPRVIAEKDGGSKEVGWKKPSVASLLDDPIFGRGLKILAPNKKGELDAAAKAIGEAEAKAMAHSVTEPLLANPRKVVTAIVNWTPSAALGGRIGSDTDDHAKDYWSEAKKTPGGLQSLSFPQRRSISFMIAFLSADSPEP